MTAEAARGVVLDTHIWVWYVENDRARFSRRIEPLIERAILDGRVAVSAISIWELAQLEARRRIELAMEVRTWVQRALSFPGLRLKGLTPSIAIDSARLPGDLHRDPADRILIATARQLGAAIVTCDERILVYARQGHVRVVDARPTRVARS